MKIKYKIFLIAGIFIVLLIAGVFAHSYYKNRIIPINCNKTIDVIYLKHSELKYASDIANKINGVVVIPEDNQIIARTELLLCPNFDAYSYLNFEVEEAS